MWILLVCQSSHRFFCCWEAIADLLQPTGFQGQQHPAPHPFLRMCPGSLSQETGMAKSDFKGNIRCQRCTWSWRHKENPSTRTKKTSQAKGKAAMKTDRGHHVSVSAGAGWKAQLLCKMRQTWTPSLTSVISPTHTTIFTLDISDQ